MKEKQIKALQYNFGEVGEEICTLKGFHIIELIREFRKNKIAGVHLSEEV